MRRRFAYVLFGVALLLSSLASTAGPPQLTVLAAASLAESLQAVAAAWAAQGHPSVRFSFDASSRLAGQIEAGAPADAFFSADEDWMDFLAGRGRIDPATRVVLLGNRLVAITPVGRSVPVTRATELGRADIRRLALAGESVPAGKVAESALKKLGAWEAVSAVVVRGDNVRTVLAWVASGEADAGLVYATDAAVEPRVKVNFTFPADSHPPIRYAAAVIQGSARAADAASFLAYCRSPEGMAVFLAAGFTPPPAAP